MSYFDTEEHLADFLFAREHVDVTILGELEEEDVEDPFRFVLCRVPREQRSGFLRAIDDLPDLMSAMGKTGYDEFFSFLLSNKFCTGSHIPVLDGRQGTW